MRRGLSPRDLGDLFDRPLAAIVSMAKADGSVFSRPVWHLWESGRFVFQLPDGDRKIAMLERDPRVTLLLAENETPYRAIEVRGRVRLTREDYHRRGREICQRYVDAYDPETPIDAYLSQAPGCVVVVDADVVHAWDYADDGLMPT